MQRDTRAVRLVWMLCGTRGNFSQSAIHLEMQPSRKTRDATIGATLKIHKPFNALAQRRGQSYLLKSFVRLQARLPARILPTYAASVAAPCSLAHQLALVLRVHARTRLRSCSQWGSGEDAGDGIHWASVYLSTLRRNTRSHQRRLNQGWQSARPLPRLWQALHGTAEPTWL